MHETTFRAAELLIGRQMQAGLDLSPLKQLVIFAPHHIQESCEICHNRHRTILPIQSQQGMVLFPPKCGGNFPPMLPRIYSHQVFGNPFWSHVSR